MIPKATAVVVSKGSPRSVSAGNVKDEAVKAENSNDGGNPGPTQLESTGTVESEKAKNCNDGVKLQRAISAASSNNNPGKFMGAGVQGGLQAR